MTCQGAANADEDEADEDEDEAYEDAPEKSAPSSVAGTKRSRDEDDDVGQISGDYGEFQEAEEGIAKRARTAANHAAAQADDEEEEV